MTWTRLSTADSAGPGQCASGPTAARLMRDRSHGCRFTRAGPTDAGFTRSRFTRSRFTRGCSPASAVRATRAASPCAASPEGQTSPVRPDPAGSREIGGAARSHVHNAPVPPDRVARRVVSDGGFRQWMRRWPLLRATGFPGPGRRGIPRRAVPVVGSVGERRDFHGRPPRDPRCPWQVGQ